MIVLLISFLSLVVQGALSPEPWKFTEDAGQGTLALTEGGDPVLTYRFGDQLPRNTDPKYMRSCYIHPLFSPEGAVLTADFPADHLHHHGIFWTWPVVRTRGRETQTWHPDDLRQHFSRWLRRELQGDVAVLSLENVWRLDGGDGEIVARETLALHIHPARNGNRIIDFEIVLQAVGGPLELQGTPDQNKGYGGLSLRGSPVFTGAVMTTDTGRLEEDSTNVPFRWADLSTEEMGIAIFVAPYHPNFPIPWLIRNSYAGFLNPSWPGLNPVKLEPGVPVSLGYRLFIHRGNVDTGGVKDAYARYLVDVRKR